MQPLKILIIGTPGNGKRHLASLLYLLLSEKNFEVKAFDEEEEIVDPNKKYYSSYSLSFKESQQIVIDTVDDESNVENYLSQTHS